MNATDPTHRLWRIVSLFAREQHRSGLWAVRMYGVDPMKDRATRYEKRSRRLYAMLLAEIHRLGNRIDDLEERCANGIPSDAVIDRIAEYHHANVKGVSDA